MSKNLVYTTHIKTHKTTDLIWRGYKCCAATQKLYADRIGADFYCQEERIMRMSEQGNDEKFNIYNLLDRYDRVLMLDADVLITPSAPDIFQEYPDPQYVYMMNETQGNSDITMKHCLPRIISARPIVKDAIERIKNSDTTLSYYNAESILRRQGIVMEKPEIILSHTVPYFNAGVVLASKPNRFIFDREGYFTNSGWYSDQDYINYRNFLHYDKTGEQIIKPLPMKWNGMFVYELDAMHKCYFLHYAGGFLANCFKQCFSLYKDPREIDVRDYSQDYEVFLPYRMRPEDNCLIGIKFLISKFRKYFNNIGLEIGSDCGELSVVFANVCDQLYCLDDWKDPQIEKEFDLRTSHHPQMKKFKVELGNPDSEKSFLTSCSRPIDFVYINCRGDAQFLNKEIGLWKSLIAPDAYICGSDEKHREVQVMIQDHFGSIDCRKLFAFGDASWLYTRGYVANQNNI